MKKNSKKVKDSTVLIKVMMLLMVVGVIIIPFSNAKAASKSKKNYGVFIGMDSASVKNMNKLEQYKTVVIDAQYFTKESIELLQNKGITVYSYLNVGSIENFRDYYSSYESITLGDYAGWSGERWIDVSNDSWQNFLLDNMVPQLVDQKGVDGLFIDNCDVFYMYEYDGIFNGLVNILSTIRQQDIPVIINGGDYFVKKYLKENKSTDAILTGINQEIDGLESYKYYSSYCKLAARYDADIYILEYTKKKSIKKKIIKTCKNQKWKYYITGSIALT